jgi:DNA (cytosine-5)-methyltransferase 1
MKSEMPERIMKHDVTALFAGVGGLEMGLGRSGHRTSAICECDPEAVSVLEKRFPDIPIAQDVRRTDALLEKISKSSDLLTAGFPCTDFSPAGRTEGFDGGRSSLILDTIRLLRRRPFANLLLENVPNWRQLAKGKYLAHVVEALEELGYRWAYRTIDARAFGLPQRRLRLFLFATLEGDPREALFHGNEAVRHESWSLSEAAHGFYWTEGNRGLGWGENCVPTLKGGSSVSIPSAPAIMLKDLSLITPDIRDCERLQGFVSDWTHCEERSQLVGGGSFNQRRRWLLVGNAVNVEISSWIGENLARRVPVDAPSGRMLGAGEPWPTAAWFDGEHRYGVELGPWPVARCSKGLEEFLEYPGKPLSLRATEGFYRRIAASRLKLKSGFLNAVDSYRLSVGGLPELLENAA